MHVPPRHKNKLRLDLVQDRFWINSNKTHIKTYNVACTAYRGYAYKNTTLEEKQETNWP